MTIKISSNSTTLYKSMKLLTWGKLKVFHSLPHNTAFQRPWEKKTFENIVGRGENVCNQHFPPFKTVISSLSKREMIIITILNLSSANALNLDQAKISTFGKELTL